MTKNGAETNNRKKRIVHDMSGDKARLNRGRKCDEKDTGKPSSIEPTLFSRPNIPDHPTRSGRVDLGLFRRSLVEVDDKERCAQ